MSLSRRQFIQNSALALCAGTVSLNAEARSAQVPLPVPPLLESRRGQPLFLTLQPVHWAFGDQRKAPVMGINGQYLGPTLRIYNGDNVKLIYSNRLSESVSMTISGLQVPSSLMGGGTRLMAPGTDWSPVVPIRQSAATCWYHANTPNRMAPQVYNGLAGLCLVEDSISQKLPIPNHYGVDDFPLIIQDKRLDNFGRLQYNPPAQGGVFGDTLVVNGAIQPFIEVSRGWVRLRLLNASNARRYHLQLSDGRPLMVIASDLGFLPTPVAVQKLSLAPGERREVLVDMTKGGEVSLTAGEAAGIMDRLRGLFEPSNRLADTTILTLKLSGLAPLMTDSPPQRLLTSDLRTGKITRSREFRLGDSHPGINDMIWDLNRTDVLTQQGIWERWTVSADKPQGFHIQGVLFLINSVNGAAAMAEDRGWKDTVWVDGSVELLVYLNQSTSDHMPLLYYSSTLEMADRGSTGQMMVQGLP